MGKESICIVIAGGCHVDGYKVGYQAAFPSYLKTRLQKDWDVEMKTVSAISIKELPFVVETCRTEHSDAVILQLGNYETVRLFQKKWTRVVGGCWRRIKQPRRRPPSVACVPDGCLPLPRSATEPVNAGRRLLMSAKAMLDALLGRPLLETGRLQDALSGGLMALEKVPIRTLIVISPLPCLDQMTVRYRKRLGDMMERMTAMVGGTYLDLLDGSWESSEWYADHAHLSAAGHDRLAQELERMLQALWGKDAPSVPSRTAGRSD